MPERQLRDLKRILVPAIVLPLAVTVMAVSLLLSGDAEIGEPRVTAADLPAIAFIVGTVAIIMGCGFLLTRRMSAFVSAHENVSDDPEQPTPFFTRARRAFIVLLVVLLWPEKLMPLPERLADLVFLFVGIGAAFVSAAVGVVTWQKMEQLRGPGA